MKNLSLIFLLFGLTLGFAKTIKVGANEKYKSIKSAIAMAEDNDIIKVAKGTYNEIDIEITRPLSIIGEDGVIVDGMKKGQIFHIKSDHVTLKNLTVQNVGLSYTNDWAAIRVSNSQHFRLENLTLRDMFFGIYLAKSSNGKVINNNIRGIAKDEYNSGNGIHLWYSHYVEIIGNDISGARDGIYFEFADNCIIRDNVSHNNLRYGLHFMFSNDDKYFGNTFKENGTGVAVMFSKRIHMEKNIFKKNWGTSAYGLLLKEIYDAEILDNIFEENTIGVQVEGSTRINYFGNKFNGNGWALKFHGAAYTNNFKGNNFSNNSFDMSYNSNLNDNLFNENYWSEYTGYDLDKDGFGDIPYRPVKLFAYIVEKAPEAIILLRSLFVDIINFSEKVSPVFTPDDLVDAKPKMQPYP
ncbi:nitrous oxide reductase family maturation protein NosD [Weeksellaceae bacterium KMM 9724]|uniref:nitrous oxide reductase family maturation protein NosD n=1 Tax=Profundicola chukchiensis TaxID=2961959 RepID=UPI0024379849|nr:nitrous oxide reductase family maturation protein NosD [Profundicola chukchiensis]MDG4949476.1 nitrous oxide reductase family maturation protein NosD [Profundicola chukchiensis]